MRIKLRRIRLSDLFSYFLVLPFFEIEAISNATGRFWDILLIIDCACIFIMAIRSIHFNKLLNCIICFFLVIIFATAVNKREVYPAVYYGLRLLAFATLIDYYARRNNIFRIMRVMRNLLGFLFLINLFFQIFAQDFFGQATGSGNYKNFLISDNFLGYYFVPFLLLVYLCSNQNSEREKMSSVYVWGAICLLSLIRAWTAMAMVGLVVFLILMVLRNTKFVSKISVMKGLVLNVCVFFGIVVFRLQYLLQWLIEDVLKKDLTLSHRTLIWDVAFDNILQSPWFGHGTVQGGRLSINVVNTGGVQMVAFSHDVFLEIMMQGGIIALAIYLLMYFFAHRSVGKPTGLPMQTMLCLTVTIELLMQFSEFAIYMPIANLPIILCFYFKELSGGIKPCPTRNLMSSPKRAVTTRVKWRLRKS